MRLQKHNVEWTCFKAHDPLPSKMTFLNIKESDVHNKLAKEKQNAILEYRNERKQKTKNKKQC